MYPDLSSFVKSRDRALSAGPVAVILAEDSVEVDSTLRHHLGLGFGAVVLLTPRPPDLSEDLGTRVSVVRHVVARDGGLPDAVNRILPHLRPGTWIFACYNAEYLFFPFCESRTITDLVAFHAEERRAAMTGMVVDLYARDLEAHPDGVDIATACLDGSGYFGLAREDPENGYLTLERQVDLYGGLRWRFEEHVPWKRRRIDRVALFQARHGLELSEDWTLNSPELNTIQCKWHHNLTAAIGSFRTAKALMRNPGSRRAIRSFLWYGSETHDWTGRRLMELGFMEPGQWF